MWQALAGIFALALLVLKRVFARQDDAQRREREDVENMDQALAARDGDTVTRMFDELRTPKSPDRPGRPGDPPPA